MEKRNAIGSQSLDAEKALSVGDACPEAMYDVADIARSFYSEKHRIIYRAMLELMKKEPLIFFSGTPGERDSQIGGRTYLRSL